MSLYYTDTDDKPTSAQGPLATPVPTSVIGTGVAVAGNSATTSALSNDLLKYSYSTTQPSSAGTTPTTKLPSIAILLSNANTPHSSSPSPSPSGAIHPNKLSISPPLLRHNNSFSVHSSCNSRSESISSLDSFTRSLQQNQTFYQSYQSNQSYQPYQSPYFANTNHSNNNSLETLTNVAQQSFGNPLYNINSSSSSFSCSNHSQNKNTFLNSQYYSSSPSIDVSNLSTSVPKNTNKYSISSNSTCNSNFSLSSDDNEQPASPESPSSSLSSNSSSSIVPSSLNLKKRRSNLPKQSTTILLNWLHSNLDHPYPNSKEKIDLMRKTGLTSQQLSNWFINARRRKIQTLKTK